MWIWNKRCFPLCALMEENSSVVMVLVPTQTYYSWLLPPSPAHLRCSAYFKPTNNYTFGSRLLWTTYNILLVLVTSICKKSPKQRVLMLTHWSWFHVITGRNCSFILKPPVIWSQDLFGSSVPMAIASPNPENNNEHSYFHWISQTPHMHKAKHMGLCLLGEGFVSVLKVNSYFLSTCRDLL